MNPPKRNSCKEDMAGPGPSEIQVGLVKGVKSAVAPGVGATILVGPVPCPGPETAAFTTLSSHSWPSGDVLLLLTPSGARILLALRSDHLRPEVHTK
jgi:hypothetical protein